ncbi:MAG TPA: type IV secretion system DNA-binding domain-containing protein [Thermoanaerobaculia bacterium]|nr:type IV secretion system DNA-binding domain-containing protein [Thermoanaerobaculia bacterium]
MPDAALSPTAAFYVWEIRGRGWQAFDYPVALEPAFRPFPGHALPRRPQQKDDGRRETILSSLLGSLFGRPGERAEPPEENPPAPEPEPFGEDAPLREIGIILPQKASVSPSLMGQLLRALSPSHYPLAFEILGLPEALSLQIAVRLPDFERVRGQLRAFFPDGHFEESGDRLRTAWEATGGHAVAFEFGLAREFMLPLTTFRDFRADPLLPLFAALSEARQGEIACFQVLFEPLQNPWAESVLRAVSTLSGEPFFLDAPELSTLAAEKVREPLYAACIRLGAKARNEGRAWELIRSAAGGLIPFADWNELVPLAEEETGDPARDLLSRTTHRTGMILGQSELAGLAHLPHESVRLPKLQREVRPSKAAPPITLGDGVALGWNTHEGRRVEVSLPDHLRTRHVHLVGSSGSGKSTLLARMILGDLARGEGVGVIDPHGDLVDEILSRFPTERERDLILFDPADEEVSLGWNMLEARSETQKTLLASDLVAVFRRLSTSWGDQMNSVLANAIVAFLESREGGTLLDLRRFLVDRDFRAEFLRSVEDSEVLYYWQKEFPLLVGKPQGPILTRLDTFLRPKPVRRVVVERKNRLDFRGMVDRGNVFLGKVSEGALGEENAALLGSLLVSAFHQAAISRQDLLPRARRHFFLYLDEFHEFATPSMAALLTGVRKYRLALTLAHQGLWQLEGRNEEVSEALLGTAATRIVFRVGEKDARELERGFSCFTASDLQNLEVGEAMARVERAEHDFNLQTEPLPELASEEAEARRRVLIAFARTNFPREVEKERAEGEANAPVSASREAPFWPARPEVARPEPTGPVPRKVLKTKEPRPEPPTPGRGGAEHQYLQELVKRWGEARGFRATIEKSILDGKGSVDVALERDGMAIACEISVTTGVEQEVGNALKCLAAGFDRVVLISLKKNHLTKLRTALEEKLSKDELFRLFFHNPEELPSFLDGLPPAPKEETVGGYRVKVDYEAPNDTAKASRSRAIADLIARRMKPKKRGGP